MDWAAEGRWHIDDLVEFEARVNDMWCGTTLRSPAGPAMPGPPIL